MRPKFGFAEFQVRGTLGLDHRLGYSQRKRAIDRPAAVANEVLVVPDGDLVAEESRRSCAGVSDQRFVLGEFQSEIVMQELCKRFLICSASDFGPMNPSRWSSAYLTYRSLR